MERLVKETPTRTKLLVAINVALTVVIVYAFKPRSFSSFFDLYDDLFTGVWSLHWAIRTWAAFEVLVLAYYYFGADFRYYHTLYTCSMKAWDVLNESEKEEKAVRRAAEDAIKELNASRLSASSTGGGASR